MISPCPTQRPRCPSNHKYCLYTSFYLKPYKTPTVLFLYSGNRVPEILSHYSIVYLRATRNYTFKPTVVNPPSQASSGLLKGLSLSIAEYRSSMHLSFPITLKTKPRYDPETLMGAPVFPGSFCTLPERPLFLRPANLFTATVKTRCEK